MPKKVGVVMKVVDVVVDVVAKVLGGEAKCLEVVLKVFGGCAEGAWRLCRRWWTS